MLVLFETPSGHALFKVMDEAQVRDASADDVATAVASRPITSLVQLQAFSRFGDTTEALASATATLEGKVSKTLKKFLKKKVEAGESLAVSEPKLAGGIKDKLGLQCVFDASVMEIMRGIRANLEELMGEESSAEASRAMVLGLAHSLSRYKLKFSPDKVDTMIIQAIGLLDDLDKEVNTYAMRLREWYGWHFPELGKIVVENLAYAKVVKRMGTRASIGKHDFSDALAEEIEQEMKEAAQISMGTEISEQDVANISSLCDQVIALTEYRTTLYDYLKNRMMAIAPNLTAMVGELVGARLISHAGSLMALAKYPASTIQILGAEKALFRALKTKHATPKYGLIYHASLVGQAAPKLKGKISRVLASKCALSIRVDALGEDPDDDGSLGVENREKVERRLRQLEGRPMAGISKQNKGISNGGTQAVYRPPATNPKTYNADADMTLDKPKDRKKRKERPTEATPDKEKSATEREEKAQSSKKKKRKLEHDKGEDAQNVGDAEPKVSKKKESKSEEEKKSSKDRKKKRESSEGSAKKKKHKE
eukprot:Plantae.Rhodophyta-Rhodochaete_pulchella.ctg45.p2 GENE.Plantae.Rhodophyta-Rhodochaete_pulchella.ctg45~~Plantae.Rhodophyta-Rhodochaete_pulchella.ctg45.p2  ORF type:complete len:539 (-),score=142.51 Plantae.Rhodophyta-Rhodochaete_pulchella.ctg45:2265-3881(-)